MIKIENTEVYGFEAAIRGMRNPMNSWDRIDSGWCEQQEICKAPIETCQEIGGYCIGDNDLKLMKNLVKAGSDHSKFMRMITVTCDITAPLYWWKEFDTYRVGTVRNSCSTMHKITAKEFTLDDFSHEHLLNENGVAVEDWRSEWLEDLYITIERLNCARQCFTDTKDKKYWWQIIQLLPSSYNQRATVQLNYAVLRNMYHARKNHKLDEWHTFCEWVESLPYSEIITGGNENGEN